MEGLILFLCCYGLPIFILLMSAPVSTLMPWASAKYSHEYYGKMKDAENESEKKRPFMPFARYSALIVGISAFVINMAINIWLPIDKTSISIICAIIGVIALVIWLVWDKKTKQA